MFSINREAWVEAHITTTVNENKVYQQLKELFLSRTLEEWTRFGLEVDCCLTPILEVNELKKHPYIIEKRLTTAKGFAPEVGEHTKEILMNILNKNDDEIENLYKKGVIS